MDEIEVFALGVTPDMEKRLLRLKKEVLALIKQRTTTPEEAFILLDAITRHLVAEHGLVLVAPIDHSSVGHT